MKRRRLALAVTFAALTSLASGPATAQSSGNEEFCRYLAQCGSLDCKIMEWIVC